MDICINQLHRADIFASLFQHIKIFTDSVNIHFRKDEMFIQAMDNSHISIFEIVLPNTWFDSYVLRDETEVVLGINSSIMFKVLHTRNKSHTLKLSIDDPKSDKLRVFMESDDSSVFNKEFEVPLVDLDSEMLSIPEMEYQAEMSLPSATFATLIDQLNLFGETLSIECSEEKIQMIADSIETGKMFVNIPIDDLNSFAIDEGESLNLGFSLQHLKNICLYSKIAKDVEINLTTNYPIKIVYPLDEDGIAKATFYLAPKMDTE